MIDTIEPTTSIDDPNPLEVEQPTEFWAEEEDCVTALDPDGRINKGSSTKEECNPWRQQSSERKNSKYPADCYSFMSLHGPLEQPKFFFFGVLVWAFQVRFWLFCGIIEVCLNLEHLILTFKHL